MLALLLALEYIVKLENRSQTYSQASIVKAAPATAARCVHGLRVSTRVDEITLDRIKDVVNFLHFPIILYILTIAKLFSGPYGNIKV